MIKRSIAIWMIIILICCKPRITTIQNENSSTNSSIIVHSQDSSKKQSAPEKLPKDHPEYVQTLQENKLENDIYYQTRKGRFSPGDSILVNDTWVYFKENLQLGTLNSTKEKPVFIVGEGSPGILSFYKSNQIRYSRVDSSTYFPFKFVYLDSNFRTFKEFVIEDHNPISLKAKKVSCINCIDGENCISEKKYNSKIDLYKQADHFWTRPISISGIQTGYNAIRYAISARDKNDCLIIDLNTIIVLDPMGKIVHRFENLAADINRIIISTCGNFIWIGSGGIKNVNMESIHKDKMDLYDLKTGKVVLHFDHGFGLPLYEFQTGLHILSHEVNDKNIPDYIQSFLYFDYINRNYKVIDFTKNDWDGVTKNYFKTIRNYSDILKLYSFQSKSF
jgi:hypothetical protein